MVEPKYKCFCGLGSADFKFASFRTPEDQLAADLRLAAISQNIAGAAHTPFKSVPSFKSLVNMAAQGAGFPSEAENIMKQSIDLLR